MRPASWLTDLLLLTALLGSFITFGLGNRALWAPDEGRYSEVAREMLESGDFVTPRLDGIKFFEKPPLFYWTQCLAIKLFGLKEWSLRLWPALFAIVGCLSVYVCGRQLFGRKTGWCAAIVLATSCLYYALSRTANLDMGLSALLTCSLVSFILATRQPVGPKRRWGVWLCFIFASLAVLQKGLIGIVLPAVIIVSWIGLRGDWRMLKTLYLPSSIFLFVAIAFPWHLWVSTINPEFFSFYFIREHLQRFLYKNGPLDQPWSYIPVLLIGLFPWTAFLYQAIRHNLSASLRPRHGYHEAMFFVLWAGWVFVFFSISSSKVIPYILPMFPPLAILLGRYFAAALEHPKMEGLRFGYGLVLTAVLLLIPFAVKGPQHYFERYSNWPSLEAPEDETTVPSTAVSVYSDLEKLRPYVAGQIVILLAGALVTAYIGRRWSFKAAFSSLALTSALFLVVLNQSLPLFDQRRSVKDLALSLKPALTSDDEVATYHAYYQDLPLYLQRHIIQVGWAEPFERWQDDFANQAGDDQSFWKKWDGPHRLFVVMDKATYYKLQRVKQRIIYVIAQNEYSVVLSNQKRQSAVVVN